MAFELVLGLVSLIGLSLEIAVHSTMDIVCAQDEVPWAFSVLQALFISMQIHFLFINPQVLHTAILNLYKYLFTAIYNI